MERQGLGCGVRGVVCATHSVSEEGVPSYANQQYVHKPVKC